jgi:hypothetical protein
VSVYVFAIQYEIFVRMGVFHIVAHATGWLDIIRLIPAIIVVPVNANHAVLDPIVVGVIVTHPTILARLGDYV